MSASTRLPALSMNSFAAEGLSVNHSAISSILTLLGWQDKRPAIMQAEEADRALVNHLQVAYAAYLALPDQLQACSFYGGINNKTQNTFGFG
jgi:hypothetical protein